MESNEFIRFLNTMGEKLSGTNNGSAEESSYNIFRILGIEAKEVLVCRFLGFLLNLPGNQGQNKLPLELFINHVLGVSGQRLESNAKARLEEVITNNRRVDLVIRNGEHVYPIEVKIWADDQDTQLEDYYRFYFGEKGYSDNKIYYLTPTGGEPSKESRGNLKKKDFCCLSFETNILGWLDQLFKEKLVPSDLCETVMQFMEVIRDMTRESKEQDSILNVVFPNGKFEISENLKTLVQILKANGVNGKLQRTIQRKYLETHLDFPHEKFQFVKPDKEVLKNSDSHSLLYIGTKEDSPRILAWVCVHSNLYIGWKKYGDKPEGACWDYISPDGYEGAFKLDDCENAVNEKYNKKITVTKILDNILQEMQKYEEGKDTSGQ